MAHSNRQKLKDLRGGLTKHQSMKTGRKNKYRSDFDPEARIRELNKWTEDLLMNKSKKEEKQTSSKRVRRVNMKLSVVERRKKVIFARELQLEAKTKTKMIEGVITTIPLTEEDSKRIKNEIKILKNRI